MFAMRKKEDARPADNPRRQIPPANSHFLRFFLVLDSVITPVKSRPSLRVVMPLRPLGLNTASLLQEKQLLIYNKFTHPLYKRCERICERILF